MKIRRRYKNNSKVNILLPLVFLFIVFLSVGYSSLNQELNITSEAVFRVEESIRITDIKLVGSAFNGIENYNSSYSKDRIKTGITLNEANSSITYQVTITNTGNVPMNLSSLENINYNNDGITYELNEKLPYMINKGEEKSIEITYKWNSYNELNKNLDSVIKFNFIKAESVLAKGTDNATFVNNSSFDRSKIESIKFMPTIDAPSSAIEVWDASLNKDGSVMAYTLDNDSNDLYELYIAGYGEIKLSEAYHLFIDFSNVITLESLSLLDTSDVTTMSNMFRNCSKLAGEIDLSHFNMQNVTSVEQMFMNDGKITTLKLNNWDAPKLTKVYEIFQWCKMASIEMNNFNAPVLSDVSDMFGNGRLANIKSISINNWNIPSVTNLYRMFYGCSKLTELNIEGFNAPSATNVANMFYGCSSLAGTLDLSNFDTSNVTNMSYMFYNCSLLTDINKSKFSTSNVTNMSYMFYGCSKLTVIDVSSFDTSKVTNMSNMFRGCSGLAGEIDLSHFNMQNVTSVEQMFMDDGKITFLKLNNWDAPKLTKVYEIFQWCKMASIEMNNFNAPVLSDVSDMFGNGRLSNIKSISINNWNIPSVTNLYRMFYSKSKLTELNMEGFNAPSATNTANMFYGCSSLEGTLDLSNFDTSSVTNMSYMFYNCNLLTSINMSKFSTSNVTNMNNMFNHCESLTNIDLSNFDTSNVTNMTRMFFYCTKLVDIDVSNFDTSNVTTLSSMFEFCNLLENLSFNNINLASATDISNMINNCPSLKTLDISGINSSIYEKDIFKSMINQVGDITFYVKDSECKTLMEAIKPNATIEIKSV